MSDALTVVKGELTGDDAAHMSYKADTYARLVVVRYKVKLVGWPKTIPFVNLSDILGGTRVLTQLQAAWDIGSLRFEPASPGDLANAMRDPASVHPNPELLQHEVSGEGHTPMHPADPQPVQPTLMSTVLHPGDLSVLGHHPVPMAQPCASRGGVPVKRPRQQRQDVKKPRRKPVKNPDNRPARRNRRGVTSRRGVLDGPSSEPLESEIEQFSDLEGQKAPGQAMAGRICWVTDDPLGEFV